MHLFFLPNYEIPLRFGFSFNTSQKFEKCVHQRYCTSLFIQYTNVINGFTVEIRINNITIGNYGPLNL